MGSRKHKLNTFICFGELPLELRCYIWMFAAHIPRFVDIWPESFFIGAGDESNLYHTTAYLAAETELERYSSAVPVPVLLNVCIESRREGPKYYQLRFGTKHEGIYNDFKMILEEEPRIYINPASDIVTLMWPDKVDGCHRMNLAINGVACDPFETCKGMNLKKSALNVCDSVNRWEADAPRFEIPRWVLTIQWSAKLDEVILFCKRLSRNDASFPLKIANLTKASNDNKLNRWVARFEKLVADTFAGKYHPHTEDAALQDCLQESPNVQIYQ